MRKLFIMFAIVATLFAVGCQKYNDKPLKNRVVELENRVTTLEELCKKMNTNISSLQTIVGALQNNDYVTGVVPVISNGETIGYTITFAKNSPITIYHGKDGANGADGKDGVNGSNGKDGINGADGKDGHTPVIGVRQDTDGVYYWTLDGEWLLDGAGNKVKAEGRDGQNGADGKDGINGSDGKDGENGKDGITPQLKIENGYWYVSTDNGTTWTNLGKATGEDGKDGANGIDGKDGGDSIFQSITQDEDNVYFTLADGEIITLPKKQSLSITFAEGNSLQFDANETKIVNYTITGGGNNNVVKAEMQNLDGAYTLRTTQSSATKGKITITANVPTENMVIVSVSNGSHTVMAAITVTIKPSIEENTITVETPGTLAKLIVDYDKDTITELTIIGNLNASDITTLKNLPNLAVLDMENVNLGKLPDYAFIRKTSLTDIKLPKTLKTIGETAFYGCRNITSIAIPDCVTSIGNSAFSDCSNITSINIPDSVTAIGNGAFYNCRNIASVYITDIAKWCAIKFSTGDSNPCTYANNLYLNGELVTDLVIPDGVTAIRNYAFQNCCEITNITIPDSVTTIGYSAFLGCSSLTNITIPDSVTEIEKLAFSNCSSLTSIYCKAQTPPAIDDSSSFTYWSQCTLYVPTGCKEAYATADYWNYAKEIIEMEI